MCQSLSIAAGYQSDARFDYTFSGFSIFFPRPETIKPPSTSPLSDLSVLLDLDLDLEPLYWESPLLRSDYICSLIRLVPPRRPDCSPGRAFLSHRRRHREKVLLRRAAFDDTEKQDLGDGGGDRGVAGQFWSNSPVARAVGGKEGGWAAPSVCILIYNENICFCQPYSRHKYRVRRVWLVVMEL